MTTLPIKPLSVNEAWQGRRFKTPAYTRYERDVSYLLPALQIPEGPLEIEYEFGLSNTLADLDNPVKPFQDILQKRYGFNDARVQRIIITKTRTTKRNEYIRFKIRPFTGHCPAVCPHCGG